MAARVMPPSASLAAAQGNADVAGSGTTKISAMAALLQPAVQTLSAAELGAVQGARNERFAGLALLGDSDATEEGRYLPRPLLTIAPVAQAPVVLLWPADTGLIGSYSGILKLFIDEQGRVQRVVLDDDGLPETLAEVARQTFQSLVFSPAELDGQRVKSRIRVEVRFDAEPPLTGPALPR